MFAEDQKDIFFARYRCPVCGRALARDLSLFLAHTKRHILKLLSERYPEYPERDKETLLWVPV